MDEPGDATELHRLHPLSVLFSIGLAARRLLLPGLFVLVFRPGGRYEIWLMILFVPAVLGALVKYASYRYRLGRDELVVREGIVTRNERHVPYARIQNIDLVQSPLQRLAGVAEVRVETAGGERPEAVMRVLSLAAVQRMRERVFARAREEPSAVAEPDSRVLARLGWRDLVLLGLTSHRGMAIVVAGLGMLWQLDPLGDVDEGWIQERIAGLEATPLPVVPGALATAAIAAVGVAALVVVLALLSIGWAVVRYHGFTVRVRGDDLVTEYGLLTRVTTTVPRRRVQLLSIRRGPLERRFARASLRIETAGHRQAEEGRVADQLWLAPMISESRVVGLLDRLVPGLDLDAVEWEPISPGARRRVLRRGLLWAALAMLPTAGLLGAWALAVLPVALVLAWVHARQYVRHAGWALTADAVLYRSGWWTRRVSLVRYAKVQVVARDESPLDRRAGMASVRVDTAGAGRVGHAVHVRYLDAPVADGLLRRLAAETRVRAYRW